MKKKISIVVFMAALLISVRLFCGVYVHDEFGEKRFFIKHRPTLKWIFYSPIGLTDKKIEDLSEKQKIEQKYFNEFVGNEGLSR